MRRALAFYVMTVALAPCPPLARDATPGCTRRTAPARTLATRMETKSPRPSWLMARRPEHVHSVAHAPALRITDTQKT